MSDLVENPEDRVFRVAPHFSDCNMDAFLCDDGSCIPDHYRCDGTFADCDGGEDEKDCGRHQENMSVKCVTP